MTIAPPLNFTWDGEAFHPTGSYQARQCDRFFVVGERYALVEHHERSTATHNHYFAALHEAWQSLPDHWAEQFPTSEHMRKFALIKSGYHDQTAYACQSRDEAMRLASAIRPLGDFSIVTIDGSTVLRFTAKSQSMRAMGKKDFQESKEKVLDYVAGLIGSTRPALETHARAA